MNKQFEKNRLDLAYQRQLQYLNAILILGTLGILSFLGSIFIWDQKYLSFCFILLIICIIIAYFGHNKINKNLKGISNQIKDLM